MSDEVKAIAAATGSLWCTISYNHYGAYCVPLDAQHRPAAKLVLRNEVYEPDTIEFMRRNCGAGDVIHAGAFFGDFLPAICRACAPGAKVWAFEPNEQSYRCAQVTAVLNDLKNLRLNNAGLGAAAGNSYLRVADQNGAPLGGGSRVSTQGAETSGSQPIEIVRIDDAIPAERDITILQLDVEGYEEQALTGGLETIRRNLPVLILEDLPSSGLLESDWFREHILSLGYRSSGSLHRNKVFSVRP
jgi:FkbM family methyltransferase